MGSRNLAFYSEELLPQAERSLALARESIAAGRTTILALIEVQRQVLDARRGHVALRLEAALSAADLERDVGPHLRRIHDVGSGSSKTWDLEGTDGSRQSEWPV